MKTVKLSDVVKRANTKEDRFNTSLLYYVGGEHIETDNVVIKERGLIKGSTIGPMFYFGFKKGDVLLVSRNPHLRKSGMVSFDGICSEKTFVLKTNDERILLQDYLPFIFQSDHFWEYAESHKSGSVNFFLNWSTLANYEFNLPDLDEQKKLAEVLWQIVDTMESYKKLLAKTDEMVKAKYVEQIENDGSKIKREKLNTLCNFISGGTPDTKHPEYYGGDIPWISTVALGPNYIDKTSAKDFLTELGVNKSATHLIKKGTLLFGNRVGVGKTSITNCDMCTNQDILALTDVDAKINILYLKIVLDMQRNYFESQKRGATIKGIPIDVLGNIFIPIPPLQLQNQFADFVQKAEESKSLIQASLDSLSAVYKKIIAENLGGSN